MSSVLSPVAASRQRQCRHSYWPESMQAVVDRASTLKCLTSPESTIVRRVAQATIRSSRPLIRSLHSSASRSSPTRRHMRMRASSAVILCPVALDTSLPFQSDQLSCAVRPLGQTGWTKPSIPGSPVSRRLSFMLAPLMRRLAFVTELAWLDPKLLGANAIRLCENSDRHRPKTGVSSALAWPSTALTVSSGSTMTTTGLNPRLVARARRPRNASWAEPSDSNVYRNISLVDGSRWTALTLARTHISAGAVSRCSTADGIP